MAWDSFGTFLFNFHVTILNGALTMMLIWRDLGRASIISVAVIIPVSLHPSSFTKSY